MNAKEKDVKCDLPVQYFTKKYLERCRTMSTRQIIQYLDDFGKLHGSTMKSSKIRPVKLNVPEPLLRCFKTKARLSGVPYQTQIKRLMKEWLGSQTVA